MQAIHMLHQVGYGHKCPTYSVEMAIKQNNSMTGWNKGHCFAINNVQASGF